MLVSMSKRFSTSFEFLASSQFWSHDLPSMTPASAELLAACLLDLGSISAALRGARARFPNSGWKSSLTGLRSFALYVSWFIVNLSTSSISDLY